MVQLRRSRHDDLRCPHTDTLASWVDNDTLQATTLTYDGTDLDFNGTNLIDVADVTFRTGASGGTVRTGTSAADKFVLQAYDVDGAAYQTVLQLDAGNTPVLRLDADFLEIDDDADTSKKLLFDLSGATTSTTTTFDFNQTASRTLTFPDETGTLMTHESADWVLLNTLTIGSSVADYDIDISGYTAYEELKIVVYNLTQVTDNVILRISPSYDGGSTFKQAVNENLWNFMEGDTSAGGLSGRFGGTTSGWTGGIWLQENWGNAAGEGWYGTIHLLNWTEASVNTKLFVESSAARIAGQWTYLSGVGVFYITADVEDALRFDCSSGNLDGGTFYIYGRKT